jgi:hypothetical protein
MKSEIKIASLGWSLVLIHASVAGMAQDVPDSAGSGQSAEASPPHWTDSIQWEGDLRLRHDVIDIPGEDERRFSRIRMRFGVGLAATDDIDVGVRLATSEGSPVSTNVTLGSGFGPKEIIIDRAFVNWHVTDSLDIVAGKMAMPWFRAGRNSMHWDSDLNPEGLAAKFQSANERFFGSLGSFSVAERSAGNDSLLISAQGGVKLPIGTASRLTLSAAYFDYTNTIGNRPFFLGAPQGNSVDTNGNFIYDYDIAEIGAEFKTAIANLPVTVFAVVAQNQAISVQDTAYSIGFGIDELTNRNNLNVGYSYRSTDADAVMGIFTDSDFAGGRTDATGHYIEMTYSIRDNIELGGTAILSERGQFAGDKNDYDRIQLDVEFLFK